MTSLRMVCGLGPPPIKNPGYAYAPLLATLLNVIINLTLLFALYHSQELKFGMKFQAVRKKFHSTDLKKLLKLIFYQTMKPMKARIIAFYQQCSSNYRNHSCIFMLEFNNNLFYCLNSMSLVHSSITHLLQYVISHFDVPLNY